MKRALRLLHGGNVPVVLVTLAAGAMLAPASVFGASFPLAFVQAPRDSSPASKGTERSLLGSRYRSGMRIVVGEFDNVASTLRTVTDGFATAADPHYRGDGSALLFAGNRSASEPLQVWELADPDGEPLAKFSADADCVRPVYAPDRGVVFASLLGREYEEHGGRYSFSLFSWQPGGEAPTRLTFNPSSDFDPVFLLDGRVLYSSWQHVGNHHWPTGNIALMLINADGTGVFPLTGNHRGPWLKRGAKAIGRDEVAFIAAEAESEFGAGSLLGTSLNDPFGEYRTIVSAEQFAVADFEPLPDGRLLLSARPAGQPSATFGLFIYDRDKVTVFHDDPNLHELSPAVGAPRARPERRISTVVADTPYGYLAVLNCYETDRTDRRVPRPGSIRAVRVLEALPATHEEGEVTFLTVSGREGEPLVQPASATGYLPSRILGEVPPAADGSVYIKVPADRPLRLQLIDKDGFAAMNERAWFWVRPNERRVCVGCHENRELSPANRVAQATRRAPTDLTNPDIWRTVSFRHDIQPIVGTTCAISYCHSPPSPTAGMNLVPAMLDETPNAPLADRFGPAYANLVARQENKPYSVGGRRIHPGNARSSPMLWMLYGRALAKQYAPAPFERPLLEPHPGPMLPASQLELIRTWVDLGAPYNSESPSGPWPYEIPHVETMAMERKPEGQKRD